MAYLQTKQSINGASFTETSDVSIIERSISYSIERVEKRFALKHELNAADVREMAVELKRYLGLAAANPHRPYGMLGAVDDLWHEFILDTHLYVRFCDEVVGRYIHHYPERFFEAVDGDVALEKEDTLKWYFNFLRDYEEYFGHAAPPHIWPPADTLGGLLSQPICRVCGTDPIP